MVRSFLLISKFWEAQFAGLGALEGETPRFLGPALIRGGARLEGVSRLEI